MADIPYFARRDSSAKGPDYSAKMDTVAYLKGEKKVPNDPEVDYRQAPYAAKQRCSECKSYKRIGQSESDCEKVVGIVKAEGVCDLFEQRDYDKDPEDDNTITIKIKEES